LEKFKPWIGSIVVLPIIIFLIINDGNFIPIIDHFTLLLHEGGHGIFRLFGSFIYTLGGSLMQIIISFLFILYSYVNKKKFGLQLSLVFLGENLFNISKYAADARAQQLPLLGGNKVYHDWNFLLQKTNLLEYDQEVGYFFISLAVIAFLLAFLTPLLFKDEARINLNLDL